jgi:nitroreductase
MDIFEAINGRRSVRKFTADEVTENDLHRILEAGRMAPSWVNFQVWEIVVIRDQLTKKGLAETVPSTNPGRDALIMAPIILAACGRKEKSGYYKGVETTVLGDWLMFDVALFLGHVTLAAHALGYGTLHLGLFDHNKVANILSIPDEFQIVELMPIGRPAGSPATAPRRRDLSEFTHQERFWSKFNSSTNG